VTFVNPTIINCRAYQGGVFALRTLQGIDVLSSMQLYNGTLLNNSAMIGGIFYCDNCNITVDNTAFLNTDCDYACILASVN
jgi:hypothetical protein